MPGLLNGASERESRLFQLNQFHFRFVVLDIFSGYVFVFCYVLKKMFAKFCFS
jgi:hypothetical protein